MEKLVQAKKFLKENLLLVCILIAIVIGFGIGIGLKNSPWNKTDNVLWFTLPGSLFIRSIELLIVPIVFFGVVSATSSLSTKNNLRITLISFAIVMISHILACSIGLIGSLIYISISNSIQDDGPISNNSTSTMVVSNQPQRTTYDIIADIFRSIIPKNIIRATTNQELTIYMLETTSNGTATYKRSVQYIEGTNVLGVLVFALLVGISASKLGKKAETFTKFCQSTNDIIILILRWIILFAPVGIASLIIDAVLKVDNIEDSFKKIGLFTAVCSAALLFYGVLVLSFFAFIILRTNPFKYYLYFSESIFLGVAATSGIVCIQTTMNVCENKLNVDKRISKFCVPFFASFKRDGSGLYIIFASIFLIHYNNIELTVANYIVILILTCVLCFSVPALPSSSLITVLVVLNSLNLSYLNISILYTVEWLLDRIRSFVSVYAVAILTVIADKIFSNNSKDSMDDQEISL